MSDDAPSNSPGSGGETAAAPPPLPSAPPPLPPSRRETPTVRIPAPLPAKEPRQPFLPAQTPRSGGVTPLVDGDLVAGVIRDLAINVQRLENSMHQRFDALEPAEPEPEPEPTETIPSPSKRQKAAAGAVNLGKYAGLFVIAAFVARALERRYPGAADAIEAVLKSLNL